MDGGKSTTVSYISNTVPIPRDKPQLAAATALAGEQLGMQLVYLDAGSGADFAVSKETIRAVANESTLPLFVGGGIHSIDQILEAWDGGAQWVVVGSKIESDPQFLNELKKMKL
jgi:putative glycerol-1-phosphate prenyltransferase